MKEKIDFVVTWVDGSDLEWLSEKEKYIPNSIQDAQRFRDWELMKYWFRGVEKFAPWVNKIYFVTWGHVPAFLNLDHPKLVIVKHEDYLDKEVLPTFNSNAIELSMHKIKGLQEQFVYFNDDMFLIKKVNPEDFFINGLPTDVAVLNPIVAKSNGSISNVMLNNMGIVNQHFDLHQSIKNNPKKWYNFKYGKLNLLNFLFVPWSKAVGLYQQHLSSSFLKSTFEKLWELEYEEFSETTKRKVRNNKLDINQWLFKKWSILSGQFYPRSVHFGKYIMIRSLDDIKKFAKAIKNKKTKMVCLNDHVVVEVEEIINQTQDTFDVILPNKCSFEK